ncbi:MAG: hypothetical protein Q8M65_02995 [Rhodoglobus sp.]|nr:hypothetical protein [Rhodoglobus sp.]
MQISVKRMLRTRGAVVAAVTALAVGLTLIVGRALLIVVQSSLASASGFVGPTSPWWPLFGNDLLTSVLPFTLGYFLALWVVAPITQALGVGHVITRAILATGIGATLWFAVLGVLGVWRVIATPELIGSQLGLALLEALTGLIVLLPLGVLGGVFQWVWRGSNPAPHHIEGLIDV